MWKKTSLAFLGLALICGQSDATLVISQYYEGTSNNKWIELFNAGPTAFDLTTVTLGTWSNANAEGYKTNAAPTNAEPLTGSLASGSVFLIKNPSAVLPSYAVANQTASSFGVAFNGNDSVGIFTGAVFSTANLLDAIGMTNAGNQGQDKSFVRTSSAPGFNLTAGSNVLDFGSIWSTFTIAAVESAGVGTNERLGASTLTAIPEPSAYLFGALATMLGGGAMFGRRLFARS